MNCVWDIFKKYWVRFCLDKCEFIKNHIEYVGYNIMQDGNPPAQYKFRMIKYWKLPESVQPPHYFIGLINIYLRYDLYFEIILKPLIKLQKHHSCKPIKALSWTPQLITIFEELKEGVK